MITLSLGPFDRHPDAKIRALVRLALHGKKDEMKTLDAPLVVEVCARGRVVPDSRTGRLTPAPPMKGDAAKAFFAPILTGVRDALGSLDYEAKCTEAKGPMGLTILVYTKPADQTKAAT